MPRLRLAPLAAAAAVTLAVPAARAQFGDAEPGDLTGVSTLSLGLGSTRERVGGGSDPGTSTTARLLGAARFAAWVRPAWAVEASAARYGPPDDGAVTPLLLGAAWYPRPSAAAPRVRPYLSAAAGLFVRRLGGGDAASGTAGRAVETSAVPGARLGAGVDAFVGRRAVTGVLVGYHLAGRFEASERLREGVATRPSGPMLLATLGLVLPRRGR